MVTYDSRPSAFTAIATTADWEKWCYAAGMYDGIDGYASMQGNVVPTRAYTINPGSVFIKGQMWWMDNVYQSPDNTIPTTTQDRNDLLVIRYDRGATASAGVIQPALISATGSMPAPLQTPSGVWDIPVCRWVARATGAIDTITDVRQFAGVETIQMLSTARPTPARGRLGIEVDTGNILRWDGTAWRSLGPKNQIIASGATISSATVSNLHTPFTIPANDVNSVTGPVAYRLHCGGHGQQGNTALTMSWQVWAYGQNWGFTDTKGNLLAGHSFNWAYDAEFIVQPNGNAALYGKLIISSGDSSSDAQHVGQGFSKIVPPGTLVTPGSSTTIAAQMGWINGTPTNNQTLTCYGATFERIAN